MSEEKHTPGPWKIGTPPPNGEQTIGTQSGMMVAVAVTGVNFEQQTIANAKLIAAAPDLLEALQSIVASAEDGCSAINTRFLITAKAAIAKATGKTS
jgi:hypothetical protein